MASASPSASASASLLDHFRYDKRTRASPEHLWAHWSDGYEPTQIVRDVLKALHSYSTSAPRSPSDIRQQLHYLFSPCTRAHCITLLNICGAGHSSSPGDFPQSDYHYIEDSLLAHDLGAAFDSNNASSSFFRQLTAHGAAERLKDLLSRCRSSAIPGLDVLGCLSYVDNHGHTALTWAVLNGNPETIHVILNTLADGTVDLRCLYDHKLLIQALTSSTKNEVQTLQIILRSGIEIDKTQLCGNILIAGKAQLLSTLLTHGDVADAAAICTPRNVDALIRGGDRELWKACASFWREHSNDRLFCHHIFGSQASPQNILHRSVKDGREDVVDTLLRDFPELATQRDAETKDGKYPLWYVASLEAGEDGRCREEIRQSIVRAMVISKGVQQVYDIAEQCRHDGKGETLTGLHQIYLDFRIFDHSEESFATIVRNLPKGNDIKPGMKFESIIHTVRFPELDREVNHVDAALPDDQYEVLDALRWLRVDMKVQEIKELIVSDRKSMPSDWTVVHDCVRLFNVRYLDWRCINLCLSRSNLEEDVWASFCANEQPPVPATQAHSLQTVESICLYTDGNENTIQQWLGSDGLQELGRLRTIRVQVLQNLMSASRAVRVRDRIDKALKDIKVRSRPFWNDPEVLVLPWTSRAHMRSDMLQTQNLLALPELQPFITEYEKIHGRRENAVKTKVAIIDDGMMMIHNGDDSRHATASRQVRDGKSFVHKNNQALHWYMGADSWHGTQMACTISSLDPKCELFIAQVCDSKMSPTAATVRKAIEWAVLECKVDIISLSLSLNRSIEAEEIKFNDALEAAATADVVVIHSTPDEGHNRSASETLFGGHRAKVISIAACDHLGNALPISAHGYYSYLVRGQLPALSELRIVKPGKERSVEGSSLATAVTAGLASLTISCNRLASAHNQGHVKRKDWRRALVKGKLNSMQENERVRYAAGSRFFKGVEIAHDANLGYDGAKQLIEEHFAIPSTDVIIIQ